MSIAKMALRISAVQALKAAGTLVGDNVFDSKISAFDHTADGDLSTQQDRPFIAVYTEGGDAQELERSGLRSNGDVTLIFNFGVSISMFVTDRETGGATLDGDGEWLQAIPATDAQFEAILDVIEVQILRALVEPDNAWAQIFGRFVFGYVSKKSLRTNSKMDDVRIAAGQIRLTVSTIADPIFGQELPAGGPWAALLAAFNAANLHQYQFIDGLIGVPSGDVSGSLERLLGITTETAHSLQLYNFDGVPLGVTFQSSPTIDG